MMVFASRQQEKPREGTGSQEMDQEHPKTTGECQGCSTRPMDSTHASKIVGALRVSPAVTRLTVYRRPQVVLYGIVVRSTLLQVQVLGGPSGGPGPFLQSAFQTPL